MESDEELNVVPGAYHVFLRSNPPRRGISGSLATGRWRVLSLRLGDGMTKWV